MQGYRHDSLGAMGGVPKTRRKAGKFTQKSGFALGFCHMAERYNGLKIQKIPIKGAQLYPLLL